MYLYDLTLSIPLDCDNVVIYMAHCPESENFWQILSNLGTVSAYTYMYYLFIY